MREFRLAAQKTYHHGNLRQVLIDASLHAIEENGVRSLTLREIGSRAGVSRMAAYRHFADKADLLFAISEAGFTKFSEALEAAKYGAEPQFVARLTAMAFAYVRFAAEHRSHYAVMFQHEGENVRKGEAGARAFGILEQTIREGQESGDVRAGDTVSIAQMVWSVVHGISTLNLAPDCGKGSAGESFILLCSEILIAGLRRTETPKRSRPSRDR